MNFGVFVFTEGRIHTLLLPRQPCGQTDAYVNTYFQMLSHKKNAVVGTEILILSEKPQCKLNGLTAKNN